MRKKRKKKEFKRACPEVKTGWWDGSFETGDIVHVKGQGLLSRLIRWFSRGGGEQRTWASHSAMVLRCVGDEVEIIEAIYKVVVRPIKAYAGGKSRLLVSRRPGGLSEEEKEKMTEKAEDYQGRKYGYWKLFMHALDRIFNNRYVFRRLAGMDDYPICSWLVAYVYDRVLGVQFGGPPDAAQPDDILDHCVEKEWEFVWSDSKESVADFCGVYGLAGTAPER